MAGYFLERFGLAVNHWSRLREFAADRRAAPTGRCAGDGLGPCCAARRPARRYGRSSNTACSLRRAPDNLVDAIHVYLGQSGLEAPAPGRRDSGPSAGYPPSAEPALHGAGRELRTHLGRDRRPGRSDTTAEPGAGRLVRRPLAL
ncbi:hypothetical protein P4234_16535 [Pseudomonas aeruginosa]|nr:hypothetical protein [Pseudomonas aeruginosa]